MIRKAAWLFVFGLLFSTACKQVPASHSDGPQGLEAHVRFLTEREPARDWSHRESLVQVAEYIGKAFEAAGARVEMQEFEASGECYQNVRGFFGPEIGERLIVGAHYDVAGELPGADDNASGVAVLIELAHRLESEALAVPVELVAFSLEEPPFFRTESMGSAVHARSLATEGVDVLGMINLEMVGYFSDEPDSQNYPIAGMEESYPSIGNFIAVVGRPEDAALVNTVHREMGAASSLPVVKLLAPASVTGVDFSDHLNYWASGESALMITDTSFYRNPHYHEASDTAETLDFERMEQVVEGTCAAVLFLATPSSGSVFPN